MIVYCSELPGKCLSNIYFGSLICSFIIDSFITEFYFIAFVKDHVGNSCLTLSPIAVKKLLMTISEENGSDETLNPAFDYKMFLFRPLSVYLHSNHSVMSHVVSCPHLAFQLYSSVLINFRRTCWVVLFLYQHSICQKVCYVLQQLQTTLFLHPTLSDVVSFKGFLALGAMF